ncbi:MAG TPA: nucleoside triphosphate pyrophosphatase [Kofleriaceae bacterium]
MLPLLLASASPRRRELLERAGVPLEVRAADVDEEPEPNEKPAHYVSRIAHAKAYAVARRPGQWVLAADTTVTIGGKILAKAATPEEAAMMLRQLAGRVHQVITAFTILGDVEDSQFHRDGIITTDVVVIDLDEVRIAEYVASGEWRGKAGAYAIQGIGAALVREVRGSVTNVIGLPLVEVLEALRAVGAPTGKLSAGTPA